ncbi:IclR family acetate operon transcriptional repressor [Nesterenkonia jeotgali]|uniref:Glycerol operon regulatory protein n=1 Tax=Nesterenkonia jeotgali TaxID=317018 RepID=A0A839FXU1_9MICC|nr:helix-turn-helix domain-containing protein [Nesterenkonia jeotgali]MBA8921557.1 IclR family acetate operon transcriptional repressor [Nesterenkonia jeotgali]
MTEQQGSGEAAAPGATTGAAMPSATTPGTTAPSPVTPKTARRRAAGVQSVDRALEILEVIHAHGGQLSLSELATQTGLPAPTAHRLLRTMIAKGYIRQLANRSYCLGEKLILLGEAAAARA